METVTVFRIQLDLVVCDEEISVETIKSYIEACLTEYGDVVENFKIERTKQERA